jgi:quercetin dioxygenase-like cupin family protein
MGAGNEQKDGFWVQPEEAEIDPAKLALPAEVFLVSDLPKFDPIPGVTMSVMAGGRSMANWVRIEPHGSVPMHAHPHEQLGLVLEGQITMNIGGTESVLTPGHCYRIPGNLPHAAVAGPTGCLVVDVFAPLREEYVAAAK